MLRWLAMGVLALAGCITDPTIVCGDQRCSADLVCTPGGCATAAAAASCDGKADNAPCDDVAPGVCLGGACTPTICGDARNDPDEVCDDGNTQAGDDCSAQCDSDETCGNGVIDVVRGEECDDGRALLSSDGCSSRCALEQATWVDVSPRLLDGRGGPGLTYDIARGELVLFGGFTTDGVRGDTWTGLSTGWARRNPAQEPPPRSEMGMAFDPVRERVVLFGGRGEAGPRADTWEWDGTTWTERTPAISPPARMGAAMVYDPLRARVVLISGASGTGILNDTWEWDGTRWTQGTGGPSHAAPAAAWDEARGYLLYFSNGVTWRRLNGAWTQLTPVTTPPNRTLAAMSYHPSTERIVLFGGVDSGGNFLDATYTWNGVDWTLAAPAQKPAGRSVPGFVYDEASRDLVLVGGYSNASIGQSVLHDDVWSWTGSQWALRTTSQTVAPGARWSTSAVNDPTRGTTLLFGGLPDRDENTWFWRDGVWSSNLAQLSDPDGRAGHGMVWDLARDQLVLFGGYTASATLGDTWTYVGKAWTERSPAASPSARDGHAMVYDVARSRTILYGGYASGSPVGDTWSWDGTTWTPLAPPVSPSSARSNMAIGYDVARDRVVVFGGETNNGTLDDTWEFDGTTWEQIVPATSPSQRADATMAYDPQRQRLVLHGGRNAASARFGDTWEWDGTTWSPIAVLDATPVRFGAAMTYDPAHRRMLVFGGFGFADPLDDTWALVYARPGVSAERCQVAGEDADGDGAAGCADPDCWGRCTPLCPPATSCDPAAPRCGDTICSALEDYVICPADCPAP